MKKSCQLTTTTTLSRCFIILYFIYVILNEEQNLTTTLYNFSLPYYKLKISDSRKKTIVNREL